MGLVPAVTPLVFARALAGNCRLGRRLHTTTTQLHAYHVVASRCRTRLSPGGPWRERPTIHARGKTTTTLNAADLPQGLTGLCNAQNVDATTSDAADSPQEATKSTRGRRKKTKTLTAADLPQGLTGAPLAELPEDAGPSYPTVLQQVRNNMIKYENCVVLTRVGNFYELYFEHAETYGPLLNLKVASRRTGKGAVPMSGFQLPQLDRYVKILVQDLKKHVAISEEFPNDVPGKVKTGGNLFDRKVVRVVSPGTSAFETYIDPTENQYLLGVHIQPGSLSSPDAVNGDLDENEKIGLAWLDSTNGGLTLQSTTLIELSSDIARMGPKEIVLHSSLNSEAGSAIVSLFRRECQAITFHQPDDDWVPKQDIPEFRTSKFTELETAAANLARQYIDTRLPGWEVTLQPPERLTPRDFMAIDKNTLRALELRETLREGNFEGCLLHSIRKTVTKGGARLLSRRLTTPSMSLDEINGRLDLVSNLFANEALQENLTTRLRPAADMDRVVQKFTLARGTADDLLELSNTIQLTQDVAQVLEENRSSPAIANLCDRLSLEGPAELAGRISEAIDEEGLSEQHRVEENDKDELASLKAEVLGEEGVGAKPTPKSTKEQQTGDSNTSKPAEGGTSEIWIMRRSASPMLGLLHQDLDKLWESKHRLEAEFKEKTGCNLTLKWTPGLGHILHVKGRNVGMDRLENVRNVGSSKSTHSFYQTDWTRLGNEIEEAKLRIRTEEQRIFGELRTLVVKNLVKLRQNTKVLDEIDVACSFAAVARDKGFVRPIMNLSTTHKIIGGRHPVVETGLRDQGRSFTHNDCKVGDGEQILLITGPNMAGKSTFLRQNALISILAQTGSFVPAEYAEIGLVDKIFSRVGSADNLYQDQSTFMVEMLETAEILKQATPRSFVIMDEVGRGTTPEDGIAVGYACLHHLYNVNRCRALFATHFHALADMTRPFDKLGCYCTDVVEEADEAFSYDHRLRPGVNRRSHALKVARVAGLPQAAIDEAARVLQDLKAAAEERGSHAP